MYVIELPISLYSFKLRLAIALKGASIEGREPPGGTYRSAEFRKINPAGTIPVLVDGDFILANPMRSSNISTMPGLVHPCCRPIRRSGRERACCRDGVTCDWSRPCERCSRWSKARSPIALILLQRIPE